MKLTIGILLIALLESFSNNLPATAEQPANKCDCNLTATVEQYISENPISETNTLYLNDVTEQELKSIRNRLCMNIIYATANGFKPIEFKKVILDGLGICENSENVNQVVSNFLNKYKQELVCSKDKSRKNSRDLHLYKSAILGGVIDLFDEILLNTDDYTIDFNAYEMVDGKKETVLDYIDKLIKTGVHGTDELTLLKDDIEDAGGKRGNELE